MTKYLLDTEAYLWLLNDDKKLSQTAREALMERGSTTYISTVSQLELSQQNQKQKITSLKKPIIHYFKELRIASGIELLNLTQEDIEGETTLPKIHSDLFDRLLVAQALNNQLTIISADKKLAKYPVKLIF
ncbi:MAG: type II toxin-antitoxin system VapC family toxin [Rickettsiales bacterium]|nr:type II toxin-antitoxin system VapC family toxin [Rickettsiales bacterium]